MKGFNVRLQEPVIVFLAMGLSLVGLLMSFDAAYPRAIAAGHGFLPPEFRSQLFICLLAPIAFFASSKVSVVWLRRLGGITWIGVTVLLLAAAVGPFKLAMNGAERWVKFGPIVLQPAEFAKLAVILYLAAIYATKPPEIKAGTRIRRDWAQTLDHVVIPFIIKSLPVLWVLFDLYLIDKEPDLGTAAVVGTIAFAILWLGGIKAQTLACGFALIAVCVGVVIKSEPYRFERFLHHAQRWEKNNIEGAGYQTVQSEVALANGGLLGVGIGQGHAKHVMPAATTDFVMATVGEEFGLLGSLTILGLLGALVFRLAKAGQAVIGKGDGYTALVLGGVAAWIGVQGCVNLLQANGTLPPIGIPFPFVSSGGSSLLALWVALGVCEAALKGAAAPTKKEEDEAEDRSYGRRHRRAHLSGA